MFLLIHILFILTISIVAALATDTSISNDSIDAAINGDLLQSDRTVEVDSSIDDSEQVLDAVDVPIPSEREHTKRKWEIDWKVIEQFQQQLLNFTAENFTPDISALKGERMNRRQLSKLSNKFAAYYSYFGPGGDICWPGDDSNSTLMFISQSMQYCAEPMYQPRTLSRKQVSWRAKSNRSRSKNNSSRINNSNGNSSSSSSVSGSVDSKINDSSNSSDSGSTESNRGMKSSNDKNIDNSSEDEEEDDDDNRNDKVHRFLLFALLLPRHPYSQQVQHILATVGPMFPAVTAVVGDAHEFRDMASKYAANSYPKILFFKEGMFMGSYEGEYSVAAVAEQLTDWTAMFPSTYPLQLPLITTTASVRYVSIDLRDILLSVAAAVVSWSKQLLKTLFARFDSSVESSADSSALHRSADNNSSSSDSSDRTKGSKSGSSNSSSSNGSSSNSDSSSNSSSSWQLWLPVPFPNLEPFIGSIGAHMQWDLAAFLVSGFYTIGRCSFLAYKHIHFRRQ